MSAVNPLANPGLTAGALEKRAYEPSMEDILASIRRIIADDQSLPRSASVDVEALTSGSHDFHTAASAPFPSPVEPPVLSSVPPIPRSLPGGHADLRTDTTLTPPQSLSTASPAPAATGAGIGAATPNVAQVSPISDRDALPAGLALPSAIGTHADPIVPIPQGPAGDDVSRDTVAGPATEAIAPSPPQTSAPIAPPPAASQAVPPQRPNIDEDEMLYDAPIEPQAEPSRSASPSTLFSSTTDSSVSSAFNVLAASRLASNSDELMSLARDMIRPLLQTWLDDNLPSMVERMVRAEIERVARGGR